YPQTNRKIDTGKTLTRWPVFVDHFNPIRAYFVINFDLSARKRLQSVVLRYFMQASRVNGLTSGVFAFLVPASCLNQKGSDTRRDNTTFPVAE
ncbi:TPA: hypothetical protein ACPFQR_004524, partial [Escherichia coli]